MPTSSATSSAVVAGRFTHSHLDAEDQVAILARHAGAFARIDEAQIGTLTHHHRLGEGEDAGKGDVEIGQDAHRRRLDHMLAKAVEIAGARTAGIDEGGDAAAARQQFGLDAERGAAPIDMGVQVDQAGRHDLAGDVARVLGRQALADRRHLAARESHVGHSVDILRRIDHPAALQYEIVHEPLSCLSVESRPY
jgi:hypothetical protein